MSDEETPGIILYSRSTSSASYRVRIALNLKRQQYDIKAMDLEQQHHKSGEYLSLNPQGLVPLLCHQLDTGEVKLSQSVAIIEYLEDTFPKQGASLLPTDAIGRARVRSLALHIACEMQPLNNSGVVNFIKTDLKGDADTLKRWQLHWAEKGFMGLEVQLESKSTGKFCHGDSPTLADCCLVPQVFRCTLPRVGVDLSKYPKIKQIYDNCLNLHEVQKAMPQQQPDAPPDDFWTATQG